MISDARSSTRHGRWDVEGDAAASAEGNVQPYLGVRWVAMVKRQRVVVLKEKKKTHLLFIFFLN